MSSRPSGKNENQNMIEINKAEFSIAHDSRISSKQGPLPHHTITTSAVIQHNAYTDSKSSESQILSSGQYNAIPHGHTKSRNTRETQRQIQNHLVSDQPEEYDTHFTDIQVQRKARHTRRNPEANSNISSDAVVYSTPSVTSASTLNRDTREILHVKTDAEQTSIRQKRIPSYTNQNCDSNSNHPNRVYVTAITQNNAISISDSIDIDQSSSAVDTGDEKQFNNSLTTSDGDARNIIQIGGHSGGAVDKQRKKRKRILRNPTHHAGIVRIIEILEDRRIKDPSELCKLQDLQLPRLRRVLNIIFVAMGVGFLLGVIIVIIYSVVMYEMAPTTTASSNSAT